MAKRINNNIIVILKDVFENYLESNFITDRYALSFYDHWLSEMEADKAFTILTFQDYIKQTSVEIKLVEFFVNLHKVYPIAYLDIDSNTLNEFANDGNLIEAIIDGLRELEKFLFYIDSMGIVFISGFDQDINVFFVKKTDASSFIDFVKTHGLYLLK